MTTKIEWVRNIDKSQGRTWNPITGCSAVSEGCRNCYARRMARRLAGRYGYPEYPHHFDVTLHPDRLDIPLRRKKPTTYFTCSMSDLFHEEVPFEFIKKVYGIMDASRRDSSYASHVFQVLTKRPARMLEYYRWSGIEQSHIDDGVLPTVWLGVSCENQVTADERIPSLLQTPAAVRFVSVEPMLGPVDLESYLLCPYCGGTGTIEYGYMKGFRCACEGRNPVTWTICGGESGPGARPMNPKWSRSLRDQCQAASIPFFFKQWGRWLPLSQASQYFVDLYPAPKEFYDIGKKHAGRLLDGREWNEMPEVLDDA